MHGSKGCRGLTNLDLRSENTRSNASRVETWFMAPSAGSTKIAPPDLRATHVRLREQAVEARKVGSPEGVVLGVTV